MDAVQIADRLTPAAIAVLTGSPWPYRYSDCEQIDAQLRNLITGDYSWLGALKPEHITALGREVAAQLDRRA